MNVLILGQNDANGSLVDYLESHDIRTETITDVDSVRSFTGEKGSFMVKAGDREYGAAAVIVTEPADRKIPDLGGTPYSVFDREGMSKIADSRTKSPVVILLDYFNESPPEAAVRALEEALSFAKKKYNTVFLSKFMRTSGIDGENLYREARNAGVTFIKYETIKVSYEDGSGLYGVEVSDGINDVSLSPKYIACDSGYGVSDRFAALSKKLRLTANEGGYINEDRYFLGSALTSRKGVFFLNRDTWQDGANHIVSAVLNDCNAGDPDKNYAVVDGEKCAFCYTCYRACPHGAMEPDEEDRVMKNRKEACDGCGVCAAVCPGNAVTMSEDDFKDAPQPGKGGKVKVFCCENSGEAALASALSGLSELAGKIDYETVPCGGRIGFEQLSGALRFYGKVIALICMDDGCRHFDGSKRTRLQAERLSGMLEKAGVDKNRVCCINTSHAMANVAKEEIRDFIDGGNYDCR